jgi:membrane protein involved in colicin uptake
MKGYKEKSFSDRLSASQQARQSILEKFKSRPSPDDPEMIRRREERMAIAEARARREAERRAIKEAEAKARAEQEAKEKAEREAREKREAIERVIREAAEAAERKAERDARYAARKARQAGKR